MVGFTYNEESRRYVDDDPEFFQPDAWRKRAENKKQGSSEETINLLYLENETIPSYSIIDIYEDHIIQCKEVYTLMIKNGVAPEQARMVLPQSMYTSYYVTGSLAAWARAYNLRIDPHAQKEIRDLAKMWDETISSIDELEHSWKALKNV